MTLTKNGAVVGKLKCSTVSANIQCMTEADFKTKRAYAEQDGNCNANLPMPLPKLDS